MLRRLANLAVLAALSLATGAAPARAAVHVGDRGPGHLSRVVAGPATPAAPTYLPTVSVAPLIVAIPSAKLVAAYGGALVNAYNAGSTANQDFSASGGQYVSRAALQAFQGASYLGARKIYDQSGNGCDLTETTAAQMLQLYVDGTGAISAISGRDTTKNQSLWGATPSSGRKLLIPSACPFNRQNVTIFYVARNPAARRNNPYLEMGDLTANADLAWYAPGTYKTDFIQDDEGGTLKDHVKVDSYVHSVYGVANLAVHVLRAGTSEAQLKARVDDREVTLQDEGFAYTSRSMTHGGQIGNVGSTGGFSSTSPYQLGEFAGLVIYPALLSDADTAAVQTALATVLKTPIAPTKSILFEGDSITEGFQALTNQTLPRLLSDHLTAQDTIVHNWGLTNQLASGQLTFFTDQNAGAFQIAGHTDNVAHIWIGINDLAAGDSAATVYGHVTTMIANARAAGWNKVIVGTLLPCSCLSAGAQQTARSGFNTLVLANTAGADLVVDYAADPTMGDLAATGNATLFPDGTHPSDLAYTTYLWPILKAKLLTLGFAISANDRHAPAANDNIADREVLAA